MECQAVVEVGRPGVVEGLVGVSQVLEEASVLYGEPVEGSEVGEDDGSLVDDETCCSVLDGLEVGE